MGRCPPGVICLENMTLLFIVIIVILTVMMIFYINNIKNVTSIKEIVKKNVNIVSDNRESRGLFPNPSYSFSNVENDVLLNPYEAPLRDNRLFPSLNIFSSRLPINIPTQSFDTTYRQIGILTRISGTTEMILPLMGRPLITNRDKWNFYTMSDKNNMVKLPIRFNGRNCTSDLGCNDLYTGDVVKVEGYNDDFKVTTYENDMPKYIPFI